jgi:beta-galactosidase
MVGSETYPQSIARNWEMVKKHPFIIGDFMWTAWDYLGEAGMGTPIYGKKRG